MINFDYNQIISSIKKRPVVFFATIVLSVNLIFLLVHFYTENKLTQNHYQERVTFAAILSSRALYGEAVTVYEDYLSKPLKIEKEKRANLHYILGELYETHLLDFEKAMSHYLKVGQLSSNKELNLEAEKHIITCLERLGRGREAAAELANLTSIQPGDEKSEPIAKLGDKIYTLGDVYRYFDTADGNENFSITTEEEKNKYCTLYLFNLLLAEKAERLGYHKNEKFLRKLDNYKIELLTENILTREYFSRMKIKEEELQQFYLENRTLFKGKVGASPLGYSEVREKVISLYTKKMVEEQKDQIFRELIADENIEIYLNLAVVPADSIKTRPVIDSHESLTPPPPSKRVHDPKRDAALAAAKLAKSTNSLSENGASVVAPEPTDQNSDSTEAKSTNQ